MSEYLHVEKPFLDQVPEIPSTLFESQVFEARRHGCGAELVGHENRNLPSRRVSGRARSRVMTRLNLTLDKDTYAELASHAKRLGKPQARVAKELLAEALARRALRERRQRLARDYAAARADAGRLLKDHEAAQLELLDDEDA
jgi:hypothetical protein